MSLFFFILTAVLYGACHWVSNQTSPPVCASSSHKIDFSAKKDQLHDAVMAWVQNDAQLNIVSQTDSVVVAQDRKSLLNFGTFYIFEIIQM